MLSFRSREWYRFCLGSGLPLRTGPRALALMGGAFFLAETTPPAALTDVNAG
jgi:hypothetical protein